MTNPRKRKARILDALADAAKKAITESDKDIIKTTTNISIDKGVLTQEEADRIMALTEETSQKDLVDVETKQTTKRKSTTKRKTKKPAKRKPKNKP